MNLFRTAITVLLVATLVSNTLAQVYETPEAAKADPDFAVQGEYSNENAGLQVIARGDGEFDLMVFEGGLPGAGANMKTVRKVEGDADVVADLVESMSLNRVERKSPTLGAKPPSSAIILFDGTEASLKQNWKESKITEDGLLIPGNTTTQTFGDYRLHVEFRTPFMPKASGQGRGNSGVYHQGRYETQVLDSFGLEGKDNETGGIYTVRAPDVNLCLPPLTWQTYDVDFTAPRFDDSGKKIADARVTVRLNGVVVQSNVSVAGPTRAAPMKESAENGPIYLQDHGNPVRFRNIWIVPVDAKAEARRPIIPAFERFFASQTEPTPISGELLISSLACTACHHADAFVDLPEQRGPDLTDVSQRVRADAILKMISDPHGMKPGTSMPDPWGHLAEVEVQKRSKAIASFLVLKGNGTITDRPASSAMLASGKTLYETVGCVACHETNPHGDRMNASSTSAPLTGIQQKYTLDSLATFLRQPHVSRKGLRMPGFVGTPVEARSIAAYLLGDFVVKPIQGAWKRTIYRGNWEKLPDFSKLEPQSTDEVQGLQLADIKPRNEFGVVYESNLPISSKRKFNFRLTSDDGARFFVDGKEILETDGIHPATTKAKTIELTEGLHPISLQYFQGGGEIVLNLEVEDPELGWIDVSSMLMNPNAKEREDYLPSAWTPEESLTESGREYFHSTGCAQCHAFQKEQPSRMGKPLVELNASRGCLAEEVTKEALNYELTPNQRAAIVSAIESRKTVGLSVDDKTRVHATMLAMNCYACHSRVDRGGPEPSREVFFKSTTPEMGLEGQIPPPLDRVGDKLTDTYMADLLQKGASERPYMLTRMPSFRYEPLQKLHESFVKLDRMGDDAPIAIAVSTKEEIAAGRQCVGNRGLACIKCHSYNGNKGGGIGAIDMLKMTTRVRPEWFHRYLLDPPLYRPGTRMPKSFVDGKSPLAELFGGDPDRQIDAMWKYLIEGNKAKEPEGLVEGAIVLSPTDRPRIYRNFFTDVSARGIGVAYPAEVNLIWDAEQMTLARLWKNSFVDASMHWNGRGQGRQQPMGDAVIALDKSVPLAVLSSINDTWPASPARDHGYRFLGYSLDASGNPVFKYSFAGVTVEDKPIAVKSENGKSLRREFTVHNAARIGDDKLVWHIASGSIDESTPGVYSIGEIKIAILGAQAQLIGEGDNRQLRAIIPAGASIKLTEIVNW